MLASPRRSSRLLQLPLSLLLVLAVAAAFLVPAANNSLARADEGDDPTQVDQGDLAFMYTGGDMDDPDRREFPVQPDYEPDLPFTITDVVAVDFDPNAPAILGYIWHVRNAKIADDAGNVIFSFAGYAITNDAYLDISVKGDEPSKVKIEATMYVIESDALAPGSDPAPARDPFKVTQFKKGKTEVTITGNTTVLDPNDLGFIDITANPSIIAIGESTTLSAQLYDENRDLDLTDGIDLTITTPLNQGPIPSVNGHATFTTYTPTAPGLKILAGNALDYTPDDPNTLAVIEVKEFVCDRETILVPSDPNDPDSIPCCYVDIDPTQPYLAITAVPNIPLPENKLPASWELRKGEQGLVVPHANSHPSDTRDCITIEALTPGQYLIIAKCGTSECKLCVIVEEPTGGTSDECPDLTELVIVVDHEGVDPYTVSLPGDSIEANPHDHEEDANCSYTFIAPYSVPAPYSNDPFVVHNAQYQVVIEGHDQNNIQSVLITWAAAQVPGKIGYVPVHIVEGEVICGPGEGLGHALVEDGAADFKVAGEVVDAKWGPFHDIDTVNLTDSQTLGEVDIDAQTLDTTGIGEDSSKIHYEIGELTAPGELSIGSIEDGAGRIHVEEANSVSGVSVDPIKIAREIVIDEFWCVMRLDLFRKRATGLGTSSQPNIHMILTARITDDVKLEGGIETTEILASVVLEGFDFNHQEDEQSWMAETDNPYDQLGGYITLTPYQPGSDSTFKFDVVEWKGEFSDNFELGIEIDLNVGGKVVATGTTGLDEDGRGHSTLSLFAGDSGGEQPPIFEVNGFKLTLNDIGITLNAGLLEPTSWLFASGIEAGIFIKFECEIQNDFLSEPGGRPGVFQGRLDFESTGDIQFSITTQRIDIKIGSHKIEISDFSLTAEGNVISPLEFTLETLEIQGEVKSKLPLSTTGRLTVNSMKFEDGELKEFSASGLYEANGFTFTIVEASYHDGGSAGSTFEFKANVVVEKGGEEYLIAEGGLLFHTVEGIQNVSLAVELKNTEPVTGSGSIDVSINGDSWEVEVEIEAKVMSGGSDFLDLALVGAVGYEAAQAPYYHVFLGVSLQVASGIPVPYTGLSITGGDAIFAYNRKINLDSVVDTPPTPTGVPGAMEHDKDPGHHAVGLGVLLVPTGGGDILDMRGGVLLALGEDPTLVGQANVWLGGGYAYGGLTLSWPLGEPEISANGDFNISVPRGDGEDAGKWLRASAQGEFAIGQGSGTSANGLGWKAEVTSLTAVLFNVVNLVGEAELDDKGDGNVHGSLDYNFSLDDYDREVGITGSTRMVIDGLDLEVEIEGTFDFALSSWLPDDSSANLTVTASASGRFALEQDVWLVGTVALGRNGSFSIDGAQVRVDYKQEGNTLRLHSANMQAHVSIDGIFDNVQTPEFNFDITRTLPSP